MQHNLQANYFVINKFMDSADIYSSCNVKTFTPPPAPSNSQVGQLYARLYKQIESHIDALHMNVTRTKSYTNVMRIVLNSLGGLAWNDLCTEHQQQQEHNARHLCRFLLDVYGEFVGGLDIVKELRDSGELEASLKGNAEK